MIMVLRSSMSFPLYLVRSGVLMVICIDFVVIEYLMYDRLNVLTPYKLLKTKINVTSIVPRKTKQTQHSYTKQQHKNN